MMDEQIVFFWRPPKWLKRSAIQQGIVFSCVFMISLFLMATVTISYVDYELEEQNRELVEKTMRLTQSSLHEIDDDPIEDDEIIEILVTGFLIAGILVSLLTTLTMIALSRYTQKRITKIESVLNAAASGKLSARIGAGYNFDDLGQISRALDDMLARLEGSVTAIRDISANIAHELKTPITRLRYNLLEFRDQTEEVLTDESMLKNLDNALEESQRLVTIFDALLRISQIEAGMRRSRFCQQNIATILNTVADIYGDVAEDAKMSLTVSLPSAPVWIEGDRELLIQMLANLIENALRYCPENSRIMLRGAAEEGKAWICVEDNGIGISDEEKARVFERMYRVDKSRTDGGFGLGLSLVKAVVGLHQGNITLYDCNPGLGIKIEIPIK